MAKEKSAIERFAESKFMRKLQEGSQKLASNEIFSTISGGMGATMGLIMVGAVIQIVCAVGAMFGWDTSSASYQAFYMPYKLTMGLMGFFMCFSMAYNYAKRKKMNQMQSVVTALVCYILVVSPPVSASVVAADGTIGSAFDALNLSSLGTGGMLTKISAAKRATAAGADMIITNGARADVLYDIVDGKPVGTRFIGKKEHAQ